MTSKERVLIALNNGQPDRVPIFELWINEASYFKLAEVLGLYVPERKAAKDMFGDETPESRDLFCEVFKALDLDSTCTDYSTGMKQIGEDTAVNKFGVILRLSEYGEPLPTEGPIKGSSDIKGFDMVSKLGPEDCEGTARIIGKLGRDRAHFVMVSDPFQISWFLRGGMEHLLIDFVENPQLVHDLAKICVDFQIAAIDRVLEVGADVIVINGDLAGETTTFMSPDHYREYIKPYQEQVIHYVHGRGAKVIKHTDGNIWSILDDLVEIGFDGIHPFQPQCMDIGEVKRHLAGETCILGNIDCRNLLPFGTVDEVEKVVKETIEVAALGGGYIISSSNTIHPGCKPENYIAMICATHKYGVYGA